MPSEPRKTRMRLHILTGLLVVGGMVSTVFGQTHVFEGSIAYPVAESNVTFSRFYDGRFHSGMSYSRVVDPSYRLGAGMEYSQFRGGLFDDVYIHVLTPSVHGTYGLDFAGRLDLEGTLQTGFSWIYFRSETATEVDMYDESGFYVSPGIKLVYASSPALSARMGISYKIIFEHFGDEAADEDSTIRYLVFGTGIAVGI